MSEQNPGQSAENAGNEAPVTPPTGGEELLTVAQADERAANLKKALQAERDARKENERLLKEALQAQERFKDINPEEYTKLQAEVAEAARMQAQWGEVREAMENKYSSQAQEAISRAEEADRRLAAVQKKYAMEKVFNSAGGRTDANGGTSFFDMLADRIGSSYRQEADGSLTVIDSAGDPIINKETGVRITPEEHMVSFKTDPVFGTFFKGAKGSGAGVGYGGTDANGLTQEDFNSLSTADKFSKAFG